MDKKERDEAEMIDKKLHNLHERLKYIETEFYCNPYFYISLEHPRPALNLIKQIWDEVKDE